MVATRARAEYFASPARATARFAPLGMPLLVEAESRDQLGLVARSLSGWEGDAAPQGRSLKLELTESPSLGGMGNVEIRIDGRRLALRGCGAEGSADADSGRAECRVSDAYLADAKRFRDDVLDPLLLFLLTRNGRVPVHAAGFVADGLAVLCAGPSGSGKSCLALAAAQAGHAVLSDDTVYVQLEPQLRVWGIPRPIHLYPADAPCDPAQGRLRNGKLKQAVHLSTVHMAAERVVLCVLGRAERASLRPSSPVRACAMLHPLEPGFDLLADEVRAAHAALTRNGAWLLELSANPPDAIRLVTSNLADLEKTALPEC